jgi:hypothetical protein
MLVYFHDAIWRQEKETGNNQQQYFGVKNNYQVKQYNSKYFNKTLDGLWRVIIWSSLVYIWLLWCLLPIYIPHLFLWTSLPFHQWMELIDSSGESLMTSTNRTAPSRPPFRHSPWWKSGRWNVHDPGNPGIIWVLGRLLTDTGCDLGLLSLANASFQNYPFWGEGFDF